MPSPIRRAVVLAVAALICVSLVGCAGAYAPQQTPQTVFETAKGAAQRKDWRAFYDCLTPETQDKIIAMSLSAAGMVKTAMAFAALGGPEALNELRAKVQPMSDVLQKHGISDQALQEAQVGANPMQMTQISSDQALRLTALVKDRPTFFADMMAAMLQFSGSQDSPLPSDARLENVQVNGDAAMATTVAGATGSEKRHNIGFRRINGAWKIDFEMSDVVSSPSPAPGLGSINEGSPDGSQ